MYSDGVCIEEIKPSITLVRFGNLSEQLFQEINSSLLRFISSLGLETDIRTLTRNEPEIKTKGEARSVFSRELNNTPGSIVIGVTNQGVYDVDKYIFGFGGYRSGILSTYRFRKTVNSPQKIQERLAKEVIKILALATGVPHCSSSRCVITYHRSVTDLDTNTSVCDNCRDKIKMAINDLLQY
jgi:predicted Zn-dependent protease